MLIRRLDDPNLAQYAYLVGCQATKQALVIDPERDVDRALDAAAEEGLTLVGAVETHIHADFISGARELSANHGVHAYLSAEGGEDWAYRWVGPNVAGGPDHTLLRDGDSIRIGKVELRAVHTPGHTPEHLSYLVIDHATGEEPVALLSGDFMFIGDLGRPDLLESAVGSVGAAEPAARDLARSAKWFLTLPDFVQVWPAHGAGSACGKALGAVPHGAVGYERRFNRALRILQDEGDDAFVDFILADQPEPPLYFKHMKRHNRDGPPLLDGLPRPRPLGPAECRAFEQTDVAIVDTRLWSEFRAGHLEKSLSIPLDRNFPTVAGSFIDEQTPIILICDHERLDQAVRNLIRVGLDRIEAFLETDELEAARECGAPWGPAAEAPAERFDPSERAERAFLLDVRTGAEHRAGAMPGAVNIPHTRLAERLDEIPADQDVFVYCQGGTRSARATSLLARAGRRATNLAGGYTAWEKASATAKA